MNEENLQPSTSDSNDAESEVDTTDVRAAIERTKENLQTANQEAQRAEAAIGDTGGVEQPAPQPQILAPEPMPSAMVQEPVAQTYGVSNEQPVTIPSDHPMAHLYIQKPMPPTIKSNRLMGVLIGLLATVTFAVLYAGVISIIFAPYYTASSFVNSLLLPQLTSLGFILPIVAFLVGFIILVLIFNRAGWWAYAVFGIIVALLVWFAAGAGYNLSPQLMPEGTSDSGFSLGRVSEFMVTLPAIGAAFAAREVVTWFGAWVASRGRRIKARNQEELHEYDQKLAEIQAQIK